MDKSKTVLVFTHNGTFHTDDCMAVAILERMLELENRFEMNLVRTRDFESFPKDGYRKIFFLDVGMVYDPNNNKFDHHQSDFTESYSSKYKHPMAACGQVWKKYGKFICNENQEIADNVYDKLIANIDRLDNGLPAEGRGVKIQLDAFNSRWDFKSNNYGEFLTAVKIAKQYLMAEVNHFSGIYHAKEKFLQYVEESTDNILVLKEYLPWKYFIEEYQQYMFVIHPTTQNVWVISAIPVHPFSGTFDNRMLLPKEWVHNAPDELNVNFVHKARFLMNVTGTRDHAYSVAKLAVNSVKQTYLDYFKNVEESFQGLRG